MLKPVFHINRLTSWKQPEKLYANRGTNMKQFMCMAAFGVLMLGACETTFKEKKANPTKATLNGSACPTPKGGGYLYTFERPSLERGNAYTLTPYFSTHPGAADRLPPGCVGDLSASPVEAVSWSRRDDGTAVATITEQAEIGKPIYIKTRYAGSESISLVLNVYEAKANPLIGFWVQEKDETCEPGSRIRELIFNADGTFSATWMPFETYKDYWGEYEYDLETSVLTLKPRRGNHIPDTVKSGKIKLENGTLTPLEGMSFGTNGQGKSCSSPFKGGRG